MYCLPPPPLSLSSAVPVGPRQLHLSAPTWLSEVGLGSAGEPHSSPALTAQLGLRGNPGSGSPAWTLDRSLHLLLRSAQGPPTGAEGCLSFGLNNHTTPYIFSLNSKAHLLGGGNVSSLPWTSIHSILDEIFSSSPPNCFFVSAVFKASHVSCLAFVSPFPVHKSREIYVKRIIAYWLSRRGSWAHTYLFKLPGDWKAQHISRPCCKELLCGKHLGEALSCLFHS